MKKKKLIIIIVSIILLLLCGIIILILLMGGKKEEEKETKEKETLPYVEENKIELMDATLDISIPIKPYSKDTNKNPVDIDGIVFEDTKSVYKFHDYNKTEPDQDGYVTYTFYYDIETPLRFTIDNSKVEKISRSFAYVEPIVFDYYTGDMYKLRIESISGNINIHNIDNASEDYGYTNITWKDKTYKIGVRMELSSKWDGVQLVGNDKNISTYTDTNRMNSIIYVYAPKDYDGIMLAINKNGSSKESVISEIEFKQKYEELIKEAEKTGKKSDELIELEKKINSNKLLDTTYLNKKNEKEDFYVFRADKIKK